MKQPMKLNPAEYATVVWHWNVPVGQTLKDVTDPGYWQHVTSQLRPGHEIRVASEDRTFWAHLFVREVGRQEALVAVIHSVSFGKETTAKDEDPTHVKWRSPQSKWAVFRKSDGECLEDGFDTKEAATVWAAQRTQVMAA